LNDGKKPDLYLIDGSALVYRSHFAFIRNPLINSKGQLVSAIYGFMNSLLRLLIDKQPEYLAVVMDSKEKTFRHERYPEYKATREKMPDELAEQLPVIDELVERLGIKVLRQPGFEADDIIGTLAKRASAEGKQVQILTGDKDFAQLVSPLVEIFDPRNEAYWTPEFVLEKWGVGPDLIIDLLGLMGDSSDNVPGVPGVGPKTAVKLINEHGGILDIYKKLDEIKNPKLRQKLEDNRESATLSRELVTIHTDMELGDSWDSTAVDEANIDAVRSTFQELELFSLLKSLEEVSAIIGGASGSAPQIEKHYQTITTRSDLAVLANNLLNKDLVCFDLETTSLDVLTTDIVGIAFSWEAHQGVYVAFDHPDQQEGDFTRNDVKPVLELLNGFWQSTDVGKTGHNLKFDLAVLLQYEILVEHVTFDSMLAAYLVNPGGRGYKMDELSQQYLGYAPVPITDLIGSGKDEIQMNEVPLEKVSFYAAEDADVTLQLTNQLMKRIEDYGVQNILEDIELPLLPVLLDMELEGTFVDVAFLEEMSANLATQMEGIEKQIYAEAGEEFNLNSPAQLGKILFEKLEIPPVRKTKTGYSTDVNVLQTLAKKHTIPRFILEYRQLTKLKSTYTDALPKLVHPKTDRIHTSFNQTIAATGRLSSTNPNFQNIPIRTELGRDIRKAFRAQEKGWSILSADYSQIELRLMAHFSGDPTLIEAFRNGEDIHTATAAKVFGTDLFGVTEEQRRQAKVVNFGIMYGAGPFRMSNELDISRGEAAALIDNYFNTYPGIREYIDSTLDFAREHKYVQTHYGRRRPVPDIDASNRMTREGAERVATNMPIQGTAADIIKLAMIDLHGAMKTAGLSSKMILQVHDELVFEVLDGEVERLEELVRSCMESVVELSVPLTVDVGVGKNWLEAH